MTSNPTEAHDARKLQRASQLPYIMCLRLVRKAHALAEDEDLHYADALIKVLATEKPKRL